MTILTMIELDTIYNEDCLTGMQRIPDGSVDCIVTDPPYKVQSRGGYTTMSGFWAKDKARKGDIFEHNNIDIAEYLPEFYRVLAADAHCYVMCNHFNLQHFFDVINASDFHFTKLLVWDKQTKICGTYYMGQVEFIFFLRKGKNKPINNCGTSDLLSFANKRDKNEDGTNIHDSQKPIGLMRTLIENSTDTDSIVLDPFMGSGTTAIAAKQCNRHFIGFELNREYYDIAVRRIKEEGAQLSLYASNETPMKLNFQP